MKKTRLILLAGWGSDKVFGDMFDSVYHHGRHRQNMFSLNLGPTDTILLDGGTDINPCFYDQRPCAWTQKPDTSRDALESAAIKRGIEANATFIGICRGAQFLTVKAGGELIQHVSGHTGGVHPIRLLHGFEESAKQLPLKFLTNSFHHQMMFPFGLPKDEYKILAKSEEPLSNDYVIENNVDVGDSLPPEFVETEIMWLPKIKGLCIQGHPEFVVTRSMNALQEGNPLKDFVVYSRNLVKEYILA